MNGIHTGIIVAVVTGVILLLFNRLTQRAESEAAASSGVRLPAEFRLARWIVTFYKYGITGSVIGTVAVMFLMEQGVERNIAMVLFVLFGLICLVGHIYDSHRRVIISDTTITYCAPFGGFTLPRAHIRAVYTANGHIAIDTGERFRKVIPMMFENNGIIVSLLRTIKSAQHAPPAGRGEAPRP